MMARVISAYNGATMGSGATCAILNEACTAALNSSPVDGSGMA